MARFNPRIPQSLCFVLRILRKLFPQKLTIDLVRRSVRIAQEVSHVLSKKRQRLLAARALPDRKDAPTRVKELPANSLISRFVSSELIAPECFVRLGHRRPRATFVGMPETAVHKYHDFVFPQNEIRYPRELSDV